MKNKIINIINTYKKIKQNLRIKFYDNLNERHYPKYLSEFYKKETGINLDWDNLTTYTEKMQWAKLYDKDPLKTHLSDKYLVREWVREKIGNKHLIPLLGVWDTFGEINFSELPDRFVLKTNHASGTNWIVENKNKLNYSECESFFVKGLKKKQEFTYGFQMHYQDIKPKIIAEKLIKDKNGELNDYKFLCFHGEVYYCWVDIDRNDNHRRNVYDLNWNLQEWNQHTYSNTEFELEKPDNFEKMVEIAEILCQGFSHVRVDLYNVDGTIYFGEMTFTNGSGVELIYPHSVNEKLGNLWKLPINS